MVSSERVETRLDWLERSFEAHDYWLLNFEVGPGYDDLRDQLRMQAEVEKVRAATVRKIGDLNS